MMVTPGNDNNDDMADEIRAIFIEEAQELYDGLRVSVPDWATDPSKKANLLPEIRRGFHTLKGSGRMAKAEDLAAIAWSVEEILNQVMASTRPLSPNIITLVKDVVTALPEFITLCKQQQALTPTLENLKKRAAALQAGEAEAASATPEAQTAEIKQEVPHLAESTPPPSEKKTEQFAQPESTSSLTLKTPSVADSAPAAMDISDKDPELLAVFFEETTEILERATDALQHWIKNPIQFNGIGLLQRELHTLKGSARMMEFSALADLAHALENVYSAANQAGGPSAQAVIALSERAFDRLAVMLEAVRSNGLCPRAVDLIDACNTILLGGTVGAENISAPDKAADAAVHKAFAEAVNGSLQKCDDHLQQWLDKPDQLQLLEKNNQLLTELAKLAKAHGYEVLATLAAELARVLQAIANRQLSADDQVIALLQEGQHRLSQIVQQIARSGQAQSVPRLLAHIEKLLDTVDNAAIKRLNAETSAPKTPVASTSLSSTTSSVMTEVVRVRADVLNTLFNLVSEANIIQGRLTEYVAALEAALQDISSVVERLRGQLRQIEFEAEMRRNLMVVTDDSDLDPLEMDRYTPLQELIRSLNETVADLLGLRDNLRNHLHDVKLSVGQQGKVHDSLQEGLMNTRMVSFASVVPRLQRITRQVSQELSKQVALEIAETDDELERSVLERLLAPLEHMLRNAIAHGIELPEIRKKNGKPDAGKIRIKLSRDGHELILEMADDGAGIDVERVRTKAIEKGMMDVNAHLSVDEITAFIFEPGFSTASQVTQIAGRGVGMDVVRQQVKALGGTLAVTSIVGKGATFTLRLPFTLSVNTSVVVSVGQETYAVPMPMVEGIIRVSVAELKEAYTQEPPKLNYGGRHFDLVALSALVNPTNTQTSWQENNHVPALLVRVGLRSVALFVDKWLGSQEMVVKPLGKPFGEMAGLAGTAVLSDGRIVVVLDLPALLQQQGKAAKLNFETTAAEERQPLILVVDDSVTVRKVSARFLTRQGYRVATAKDGIEAQEFIKETQPDLILLDVEMPRMDGFEFATFVRATEKFKHIPIIMITSRTGRKHRDRAQEIGVQGYLGKPFQEPELLALMQEILQVLKEAGK